MDASKTQMAVDDATTPTRANFSSSPVTKSQTSPQSTNGSLSKESAASPVKEDVDMDDSDGENAGSDDDGDDKSGKKKKSQRFYCTDYPPCNLSFTRSEHLARHIR